MKKVLKCFAVIIISLFFINDKIHAEKYKCEYEDDKGITTGWWIFTDTTKKFQYTVDTENRTISSDNVHNYVPNEGSNGSGKIDAIADILADSSKDESYYVDIFEKNDWKCVDRVYMCKYIQGVLTLYTVLFDDTLRNTIENSDLYFYDDNGKNTIFAKLNRLRAMSEKEINAYRLTSLEEPTDEMLAYIMHEAAEEANQRYDEALERYFLEIKEIYQEE